jgi:O-antigen/teichoic acid export membrane protein
MSEKRSTISDGVWVAGMQGLAALGQLVGIRLLTGILPPSVFGEFGLWLGVATLVAGALAAPTIQALMRFYPEYAQHQEGLLVRRVARRQLIRLTLWFLPLFAAGSAIALVYGWINLLAVLMLVTLIALEIVRMQGTALLNAVRAHRAFGIWSVAESWGRPLLAWLLVSVVGLSATLVLAGYLLASLATWLVMRRFVPRDVKIRADVEKGVMLESRFWQYVLPLLPLGLLGWISGMADRYMIGALLDPAAVGLYVAIYGISSRPMLMFGGIVETTLRPVYQHALVTGVPDRARYYLGKWVAIISTGSTAAIALAWLGHEWFAQLLLGDKYRGESYLMPWLVTGYAFYLMYQIIGRICYAQSATQKIFIIEGIGAVLALLIGYLCIQQAGLWGAAIAVPLYFGAQFGIGLIILWKFLLSVGFDSTKGRTK